MLSLKRHASVRVRFTAVCCDRVMIAKVFIIHLRLPLRALVLKVRLRPAVFAACVRCMMC